MAGVRDLPGSLDARDALALLDYLYFPYRPDVMHWFCKPGPKRRSHHLHLVPHGSELWRDRIGFRDYLRSSADVAAEYAALKAALAAKFRWDRAAYTAAKSDFVAATLRRAAAKGGL